MSDDLAIPRQAAANVHIVDDRRRERDACGVGFVADITGRRSHRIIADGLQMLGNLEHRGAVGADPLVGDGAGVLLQIPDELLREEIEVAGGVLPGSGEYGVAVLFLPRDDALRHRCERITEAVVGMTGLRVLAWRDVPTDNTSLSSAPEVRAAEPVHRQVIIGHGEDGGTTDQDAFERRLYVLRKVLSNAIHGELGNEVDDFYVVSMSSRTIVYKGMFLAAQLAAYFADLTDVRLRSAFALVHQRFSTNTFPSWKLAHPYRMVAHNGEINTLRANTNWMRARQASMRSPLFGDDLDKLWPVSYEGQSDTACLDNAIELLVMSGYDLAHAALTLVPEAWDQNPLMSAERRAFYEFQSSLMEPWDGPAAIAFSDGRVVGAMLDRNGLRPARYVVTDDDRVVMASEAGALAVPEERIIAKGRLQPGKLLLVDLEQERIVPDAELKQRLARMHPYAQWVDRTQVDLADLPTSGDRPATADRETLLARQRAFGYTREDIATLLAPMAANSEEATGSMGTDTPLAALSDRPSLFFGYFQQAFAQVTNPAIDPIREELVTSLRSFLGPRPNLLDSADHARRRVVLRQPVLSDGDLAALRGLEAGGRSDLRVRTLDATFASDLGPSGLALAIETLCRDATAAALGGEAIVVVSDRAVGPDRVPVPSLLATAAVHNHLVRTGLRTRIGLVVESGEVREVHHVAALAGYGAEAINPYLAFETVLAVRRPADPGIDPVEPPEDVLRRYVKAIDKGLLKIMSKMGISTFQSYCGAQMFDAVGLSTELVASHFAGTPTSVPGVGLDEVARDTLARHARAYVVDPVVTPGLELGGEYRYRTDEQAHVWTPEVVADLQHAVRTQVPERYRAFSAAVDAETARHSLRGRLRFRTGVESGRAPIALDEVEPAAEIVRRFSTGAMSFGSISREAHTTLAIAMNRIGGRSNTGEGGEEADRFLPLANGDSKRSAIKQVASGRFGVTADYLVNADMIQIKIAQGAKPGEGGQLPGAKIDEAIAAVRRSTPGVTLISPPPHHDVYSIEDLSQLVFDLKNVNPAAAISVKLAAVAGVGTIAAGVAKARADHITIAGHDGGTGAAPLTSIKHAGSPWEIGLAEAQQTLVANHLRSRVGLQVDGGLRTGRDVVVAAMLGADEFGFSTAPLVAAGCILTRKCHLNTCPVGVATQHPALRARFRGLPEHVINYFFFVAEEVRERLAALGVRSLGEVVGRADLLDERATEATVTRLDLSGLLHMPSREPADLRWSQPQDHHLDEVLDRSLINSAACALEARLPVEIATAISNSDRATGAMLSGEVASRFGADGLPRDTIVVRAVGSAGQSFGAFLAPGVTLVLDGEANDYVGKGLSGGRIILRPAGAYRGAADESVIAGNTVLYGATGGECFLRGVVGERFAVRNSGAVAVVEGVGDHGCEYMTGGVVLVLGRTGRNFAAGMSGGLAYVFDEDGRFDRRCNAALVTLEPLPAGDEHAHLGGPADLHRWLELNAPSAALDHHEERVWALLTAHYAATGSQKAELLLRHWPEYRGRFVTVVPTDYRRVLEGRRAAELAALAPLEAAG